MSKGALRRLNVLQTEAEQTPVPTRKFFHVGKPEVMQDEGHGKAAECIPMLSWVDDNLSRYVLSDAASSSWSADTKALIVALPNIAIAKGDGVFVMAGHGTDESVPNPSAKGRMHFVHLGLARGFVERGITRLYIYRLEGVQMKGL